MTRAVYIYDAAGNRKAVRRMFIYDAGGNRKQIQRGFIYDAGGNRKQFFAAIAASLVTATYNAVGTSPVTARWQVSSDGYVYATIASVFAQRYQWKTSADAASAYEIFATYVSGSVPGGSAQGSWLNLGTAREWTQVSPGTIGTTTDVFDIAIRAVGQTAHLANARITLVAQKV